MKVVGTIKEVRELVKEWKKNGETVGFVPTMGPARVLLPSGERPAPTEAGAETGAAERWCGIKKLVWYKKADSLISRISVKI